MLDAVEKRVSIYQPEQEGLIFPELPQFASYAEERQYRKQLRFAAGFKTDARAAVTKNLFDHTALLIDLDGIDCRISTAIVLGVHRRGKRVAQSIDPIMQDVVKAHQYRKV